MAYLVDSDWVIEHLAGAPEATALLERLAEEGIAISVVTYTEAYQGALRSAAARAELARFAALARSLPIIPVSAPIAERCALLRERLRGQRAPRPGEEG